MIQHYQDYFWKSGKPYGKAIVDPSLTPYSYKIVVDPYYKRYSIEKYKFHAFDSIIYDSALLDFRHLNPLQQTAWQQEIIEEKENQVKCLIRNQDDRVILIETHLFEKGRCRSCTLHSIHGVLLSTHNIFYKDLGDPFNGVLLFDAEKRPVMSKKYDVDPSTNEFATLLEECWDKEKLCQS